MRAALSKANSVKLRESEWRTLGAVLILLPSYSRIADTAYVQQVAERAKLSYSAARRALARLDELGVIEYESRRGRGEPPLIRLPLNCSDEGNSAPPLSGLHASKSEPRKDAQNPPLGLLTCEQPPEKNREANVVDEELDRELDEFDLTPNQRVQIRSEDPERIRAWLNVSRERASNVEAYLWSGVISGSWPNGGLVEVRGTHGTTLKHIDELRDKPSGPHIVYVQGFDSDEWKRLGPFDYDEAKRVRDRHALEDAGAYLEPARVEVQEAHDGQASRTRTRGSS